MVIRRTVMKVIDGDTLIVNRKIGGTNRIRLAGVRAPERDMTGYSAAANQLRNLVEGKSITIIPVGKSYGRIAADARSRRRSINKRLK